MPETSMAGREEKYSTSIKKMSKVTKAFCKEEELETLLENLSKNKYEIELDISKAKRELEELFSLGEGDKKSGKTHRLRWRACGRSNSW